MMKLLSWNCYIYGYFIFVISATKLHSKKRVMVWRKKDSKKVQRKDFVFTGKIYENDDGSVLEPIDYYSNITGEHILNLIVEESNKYSIQKKPCYTFSNRSKTAGTVHWHTLCNKSCKNAQYKVILEQWILFWKSCPNNDNKSFWIQKKCW